MLKNIYIRLVETAAALAIISMGARYFYEFNILNVILGLFIGLLLQMTKFKMLSDNINKVVELDIKSAQLSSTFAYLGRYMLTAIVLAGSIMYSVETFIGAVLVLVLGVKVAAFTTK